MTSGRELHYDTLVSGLAPVSGGTFPDGVEPLWSPLSHTLIYGPRTSLLVDPPITRSQTAALADWIDAKGRSLDYIYITHWHGDHWLGTRQLLDRNPHAVVLASTGTLSRINESTTGGRPPAAWIDRFPDQLPQETVPINGAPIPADGLDIDGHRLYSLEVGHSDTDATTVLHVPSLGLVVAGDVVYNNVHQYLAETPNGGFEAWHQALDAVASLAPRIVIAGHKDPGRDDTPSNIDETHRYLDVGAELLSAEPSRREFFDRVVERYADRINPYIVWMSAQRLLGD